MGLIFGRDHEFDPIIQREAAAQGVPVPLIKAVIAAESQFIPSAYRYEAARDGRAADASRGLMQLLLSTARGMGYTGTVGDDTAHRGGLYDPATNIHWGTRLIRGVLQQASGKIPEAISAYNGGFRPSLGFGTRATAQVTVCLARDKHGTCVNTRIVPKGQFGNQPYVDKILGYYQRYAAARDEDKSGAVIVVTTPVERVASDVSQTITRAVQSGTSSSHLVLIVIGALLGLLFVTSNRN